MDRMKAKRFQNEQLFDEDVRNQEGKKIFQYYSSSIIPVVIEVENMALAKFVASPK